MACVIAIESLLKGKGKALILKIQRNLSHHSQFSMNCISSLTHNQRRTFSYVSELRKSAIDTKMLRFVRSAIHNELHHSPPQKPSSEINGFKVNERPGEEWINLEKKFGEIEEIKIEANIFDDSGQEIEKSGLPGQEVYVHLRMIVTIFKRSSNQVLTFTCSAWPDTVEITHLFVGQRAKVPHQTYTGPEFRKLDEELQDSLYEFLEQRGINDSLSIFLHKYVNYKVKAEYIRWMKSVKSLIEN